jgi:hypothetical protein
MLQLAFKLKPKFDQQLVSNLSQYFKYNFLHQKLISIKNQKNSCQSKQCLYKLNISNLFCCLYLIQWIQSTHGCQMVMKKFIKFKQSK